MNRKTLLGIGLLAVVAVGLSACGGGGGGGGSATTTTITTPTTGAFGANFGTFFNAPANSEPAKPASTDIAALDLTKEPLPVH